MPRLTVRAKRSRVGRITVRVDGIDFTLYKSLNGFAYHHDGVEDGLRFFALNAQFFFVGLLAVLFFVRGKWRSVNGRHGVVAAGFSALLALGIAQLLADWVARPRPYIAHAHEAHLFIAQSHDPSFPSDHATAAFAVAVALVLRHRKAGLVALALAVLVSVGRVAVGTHYPGDVAAGAAIGTAAALVMWHPSVRQPLHRLAEWSGRLYERLLPLPLGTHRTPH
jgi:undecaprenyl-diphosphatase